MSGGGLIALPSSGRLHVWAVAPVAKQVNIPIATRARMAPIRLIALLICENPSKPVCQRAPIKTPPSEEMLQRRQVELRVDARIVAGGLLVVLMVSRIRMMLRGHMRNSECRVVQQVRARQSAVAMQIGFPGKRQRHIADCQLRTDDRIPVSALVAG